MEFYDAFAGDLASHGYIVVGVNHPYDVAAVALQDGQVAQYIDGPMSFAGREVWTGARVAERTADLLFVLSLLHELNGQGDALLSGRMDLTRVGVMGHSLGGITAAQACQAGDDLAACLNLDGIQRGGPFSADDHPSPPRQPFMMITKEKELTPAQAALFAAASSGSYRVVLPAAAHDSFTDGALLRPSLLPGRSETILAWVRAYTLAFFEQKLLDRESELLHEAPSGADVLLEIYAPS
jgi:pimeloyl-ACP methyl ester carboxylesterase